MKGRRRGGGEEGEEVEEMEIREGEEVVSRKKRREEIRIGE